MASPDEALTRAVRLARDGDWQGAHEIVQRHEGEACADWLHAVIHRIEGDLGNARYWYRRCGRPQPENEAPQVELARIAEALSKTRAKKGAAARRRGTAK